MVELWGKNLVALLVVELVALKVGTRADQLAEMMAALMVEKRAELKAGRLVAWWGDS